MSDVITISTTTWRGQAAWDLISSELELVITQVGGHLACLRSLGDHLNPLWQPDWPAALPEAAARGTWGTGPEASLLAAIVGHNLCIDRFGPAWPGEQRPVHGEAGVSAWTLLRDGAESVVLTVALPEAGLRVERSVAIAGTRVTVTTKVTQQGSEPQPIEWCEHASIGDPFLDGAAITAGVDTGWTMPGEPEPSSRWSAGGRRVPASTALQMPAAADPTPMGDIVATRVQQGWWRIAREDLGRTLTYRWDAADWPWLCLWSEHRSRPAVPWCSKQRARGMEFSTKPFPEGKPPAERQGSFAGVTATCLVPPGPEGLTKTFTIDWQ